jgi:hypothetical protein
LHTTPANRTAGSNAAKPRASAAMLRAMPDASHTSTTGAASHFAISAVEPSSPVGDAPSYSPMTPSISAISAPWALRSNVAATASRPIIQPSRFAHTAPAARA